MGVGLVPNSVFERSRNTHDMQPMVESSSEAIDFRAASELFAEYRELKKTDLETLHLVIRYQGRSSVCSIID